MDYAPWEGKQMGAYGDGAGAAYVFSRSPAAEGYVWDQDQVRADMSFAPVSPPTEVQRVICIYIYNSYGAITKSMGTIHTSDRLSVSYRSSIPTS